MSIYYKESNDEELKQIFNKKIIYRATLQGVNPRNIVNFHFVDAMRERGLWNNEMAEAVKQADGDVSLLNIPEDLKQIYKIAFDRDQEKLIEATAARQKWIDQGISFNLYNGKTSLKFLNDIYLHSANEGLKSTYYLRNQAASKIQKVTSEQQSSQNLEEFQQKLEAAECHISRR